MIFFQTSFYKELLYDIKFIIKNQIPLFTRNLVKRYFKIQTDLKQLIFL